MTPTPTPEGPSDAAIAIGKRLADALYQYTVRAPFNDYTRDAYHAANEALTAFNDYEARTPPAQGGGGEDVTLPMIVWSMRNWASVADTCAVTEGHAPACIRTWADLLEALATQQPASVEADECPCGGEFVTACIKCGEPPAIAAHGGSGEGVCNGCGYSIGSTACRLVCPQREPTPPTSASDAEVGERDWRVGWARSYSGSKLYSDDGELQDNSTSPFIDWLHDSAACIAMKIEERARKQAAALTRSPARVGGESS